MTRPHIVFASGQLLTEATWTPQAQSLAHEAELIFADHGRDDTIAGMARTLLAQAPERFHLAAHAMGGFVAFEVMRTAPERVLSLALISTLAPNDGPAQTERRQGYIRLVEAGRFAEVVEERLPILLAPASRRDPTLVAAVRGMAEATGPARFLGQQRAIMSRVDSRPRLSAIRVPTLVIRGAHDGITTEAHQAEIAEAIAGARAVTIAEAGHMPTLETPAVVTDLLRGWFGLDRGA